MCEITDLDKLFLEVVIQKMCLSFSASAFIV